MNIFEALSRGKGYINEENISSLFAYFLDPKENHGLSSSFLQTFLSCIGIDEDECKSLDINNFEVKLEFKVSTCKNCFIDMVFETDNYIVAIENKILEQSKSENQLQNEYNGLLESEYYKDIQKRKSKTIILCYLIPQDNGEVNNVKVQSNDKCIAITWKIIIESLKNLLIKECNAEIDPINEYTKQTLKAFINYMQDVINPKYKYFDIDNKKYRIYKYSSGQIIVKENINKNEWISAEPSSKAIIKSKLKILNKTEYNDETMSLGTTRSLGTKLFKLLK